MEEKTLIRLCKKQDRKAQKVLYERYQEHMFRTCYRYLNDAAEAEDVLVKGFFKVFDKFSSFEDRGPGSLEGWIKKIMINEALMLLRKRKDITLVPESEAFHQESGHRTDGPQSAEDIYALIRQLPTGYRTVLNLFAIEGYSHKEIAKQLGISENTSKSQLRKARTLLSSLLNKNGFNHENEKYRPAVKKQH